MNPPTAVTDAIPPADRRRLRDLARRLAGIAADPVQEERRRLWYAQNALRRTRPPVLVFPEGGWVELTPPDNFRCTTEPTRAIERDLIRRIYAHEHFHHDQVVDAEFRVPFVVQMTDWGLDRVIARPAEERGAYSWEGAIRALEDIELLQTPRVLFDAGATERNLAWHEELFGDILGIRLRGSHWWALGLIEEWTNLRGIEQTFWDMYDHPEIVHAGMRRLMEGRIAWLEELERIGVLSLNNENDYVGSGGFGFTRELPQPDFDGGVRLQDMWGFAEAQVMSEVSPAMHDEFVLRYQVPILQRFGLNCYGCCEPLDHKLELLLARVPRLRRISISPFADVRRCAEMLGDRAIFSWKPNPAMLAAISFDDDAVRRDIRETLDLAAANGCVIEVILKDTHTCNRQPDRFDRWARIAMEEAQQAAG